MGFWVQVVLGVVALLILLFALLQRRINLQSGTGLTLGLLGIGSLALGTWLKYQGVDLAHRLAEMEWEHRPRKEGVLNHLCLEMGVALVGMLATLLGSFVVIGSLFAKALLGPLVKVLFVEGRHGSALANAFGPYSNWGKFFGQGRL